MLAPRVSGAEFRRSAELALSTLAGAQLTVEIKRPADGHRKGRGDCGSAADGHTYASRHLERRQDALVLGAVTASDTPSIRKAIGRAEGLAALVLQHHFGKPTTRVMSPADLRAELAVVALERAFGNKIKTGLSKGAGLPAKPGRLLAGQLFKEPREIASDGKLIVQLACEIAGAREPVLAPLELALLRTLLVPKDESGRAPLARPQRQEPQRRPMNARKEHKPKNSALDIADDMGIEMLTEEQYLDLQKLGKFDSKTSSWLRTPLDIRKLGGAISGEFRFGRVFVYANGAESYFGARGFRGSLRV